VTVRELIEKLAQMPPDDDVYYSDDGYHIVAITSVAHASAHGVHYVEVGNA
jgi:hypothetical protein